MQENDDDDLEALLKKFDKILDHSVVAAVYYEMHGSTELALDILSEFAASAIQSSKVGDSDGCGGGDDDGSNGDDENGDLKDNGSEVVESSGSKHNEDDDSISPVDFIRPMFPDLPEEEIREVLRETNGDVTSAVEMLIDRDTIRAIQQEDESEEFDEVLYRKCSNESLESVLDSGNWARVAKKKRKKRLSTASSVGYQSDEPTPSKVVNNVKSNGRAYSRKKDLPIVKTLPTPTTDIEILESIFPLIQKNTLTSLLASSVSISDAIDRLISVPGLVPDKEARFLQNPTIKELKIKYPLVDTQIIGSTVFDNGDDSIEKVESVLKHVMQSFWNVSIQSDHHHHQKSPITNPSSSTSQRSANGNPWSQNHSRSSSVDTTEYPDVNEPSITSRPGSGHLKDFRPKYRNNIKSQSTSHSTPSSPKQTSKKSNHLDVHAKDEVLSFPRVNRKPVSLDVASRLENAMRAREVQSDALSAGTDSKVLTLNIVCSSL